MGFEERHGRGEGAVLVGVQSDRATRDQTDADLDELEFLARTAGAEVRDRVIQKRARIHPAQYLGKGKALEVAELARDHDAELIIFDNDLSPAQVRNLERMTGCRVVDRSELILDIFALRARTRQARVQVELAQLQYLRPRLTRMWTHLERYEGGIGMRGPGEKQLEIDRRLIDRRLRDLRRDLARIERQCGVERKSRRSVFRVALVGYTNAGKSTLLNRLTGADVYEADELFATLDTRTRRWELGDGRDVVLSDTVGFLNKLPHHLIASFHATLGEALEADLLLHVIDASHPRAEEQLEAVERVIGEIGASGIPVLPLLNKMDAVAEPLDLAGLRASLPDALEVSARTGQGLDRLGEVVVVAAARGAVDFTLRVELANGRVQAWIRERFVIAEETTEGDVVLFRGQGRPEDLARARTLGGEVLESSG